ncbi:hybrid sensor histidine kinase/response regulator [Marinomonas transparens]|uniref:histidine kinase n=1 Tax=Marinomonas transparens TaxID=2795388 RepID=A0A934MUX8_9GAMM|nr:hybrid sensor histidine kinase/response regulator [Marinomonas transparens]MBJ7536424.1 sensor histidine kinase [Marinomonas transparens]
MRSLQLRTWATRFQQWIIYGLIALIITIAIAVFGIISYTNDGSKANSKRIFESILWNSLQLQLQTYRFLNYLIELDDSDFPLKGNAFFEYDLLMSRVDLLRAGTIGSLIRSFSGGRTIRALNIINGELELISLNLAKIESGDVSYLPDLIDRIEKLNKQINEFVILVNQGSNNYIAQQHDDLQTNLDRIQLLTMLFLTSLLFLFFFIIKGLAKTQAIAGRNRLLDAKILTINEEKSDMISFINQEVKAPINAILSVAKALTKESQSHLSNELSNNIEESAQQLLSTVDMFADLALIDAKKLTLITTTGNLKDMIEDCLHTLEPQLTRKGLQAISYIDPSLPKEINIDFPRLREIISALLQNAVAHTLSGSISLQVRPSSLTPSQKMNPTGNKQTRVLQIAIRDTGIGMDSHLQQSLRTPSKKQDITVLNEMGLPLTLCHQLVNEMEGEIHFSCVPQKGCEFWVNLPFHMSVLNQSHPPAAVKNMATRQALIVESDTHLAKILSLQLDALNIDATLSEDGNPNEEKHYDLIILGTSNLVDNETEQSFLRYYEKSMPFICYNKSTHITNKTFLSGATFLSTPLTQSQLEKSISHLFPPANKISSTRPNDGAKNHD